MKIMIWNAARGGMRSVVESYARDGFLEREKVHLIHAYSDEGFVGRQITLIRALVEFAWLLMTRPVELVHCHAAMYGSFWRKGLFASLARMFGKPVLLHLHGSEMKVFYDRQRPFAQNLIRRHLERATRVLVLSQSWKTFVSHVAPAANIVIVPNYVVMGARAEQARSTVEILFLGLIGPRKGTFDLLEAFAEVRRLCPSARLTIGGNGQLEKAEELAAAFGIQDQVRFTGWVDATMRDELLRNADIFVLPSYNEGLPMSVLEAMAHGIPVVTTPVGGIPELVTPGVDGLLVTPGDKTMLASALAQLIDDEPFRRAVGEAGQRRVREHYSDMAVLPILHQLYAATAKSS